MTYRKTMLVVALTLTLTLTPDADACHRRRCRRAAPCRPQAAYAYPVAPTVPAYYRPAPTPQAMPATVPTPQAAIQSRPAPVATQPPPVGGDAAGFMAWLNNVRAGYRLPPVGYDASLEAVCVRNNALQSSHGIGHHFLGHARRQNSANGYGFPGVESAWMNSSGHRAALLDPSIRAIGIAWHGTYATFSAN